MSVEDVERTVHIVTIAALVLSVFAIWLSDLTRSKAPLFRMAIALPVNTLLFIYHVSVALSAERVVFRWSGILGALLATSAAYRLSLSSERLARSGSFLSDLRTRQLSILLLWLLLGGPVWAAL